MFVIIAKRVCPPAKSVCLLQNKCIHLAIGRWCRTLPSTPPPKNRKETRAKSICKTSFQLSMHGPDKNTETRQKWKSARKLADISCAFLQTWGNLLAFFHLCLVSAPVFRFIPTWNNYFYLIIEFDYCCWLSVIFMNFHLSCFYSGKEMSRKNGHTLWILADMLSNKLQLDHISLVLYSKPSDTCSYCATLNFTCMFIINFIKTN